MAIDQLYEDASPEICPACGHGTMVPLRLAQTVDVEPIFCREPEACKMLGNVSRETLWKWRKAGKIEAVKYGKATLYVVESLKAFAKQLRSDGRLARIES